MQQFTISESKLTFLRTEPQPSILIDLKINHSDPHIKQKQLPPTRLSYPLVLV